MRTWQIAEHDGKAATMGSGKKQSGAGLARPGDGDAGRADLGSADPANVHAAVARPAPPTGLAWEYAPAPESRDVVTIASEYGLFVNGEFRPAAAGRTFATENPATGEKLATVAEAGPA